MGITKKNIRFYEAEGLLAPRRNSENGYRDYGETEVEILRRIKLLRKLGLPLEEIRQTGDARRLRYVAPAVVTVIMVAFMASLMALMIWGFTTDADQAPPLPLVVVLVAIPGIVILGVLLALIQRVQEIEKGEIDDARKY